MKAKDLKANNAQAKDDKQKELKKIRSHFVPVYVERSYNFEYTLTLI